MEKHLILLDLDGTLLQDDQKISYFNKKAIEKVRELGHQVIIVTGRAYYRSDWYYDELGLDTVFFNRNSGHIHHPCEEGFVDIVDIIPKSTINEIMTSDISHYFEKLYFESKNDLLVLRGDTDFYNKFNINILNVDNHNTELDINLVSMFVPNDHLDKIVAYLNQFDTIYVEVFKLKGKSSIMQLYPKRTNKINAIKWLSDYYDVPQERIIAIGDGGNDIEMIKGAGIGVAMANAIDEVKAVAKVQLEFNNNESAIGRFLERYFNINI